MSKHRHPAHQLTWHEVESSNVEAIAHKGDTLYVRFTTGRVYEYRGVSRQRAVACRTAPSVGHYLNAAIIPNYEATQVA
jgi:hypothetical protein